MFGDALRRFVDRYAILYFKLLGILGMYLVGIALDLDRLREITPRKYQIQPENEDHHFLGWRSELFLG